MKPTLKKHSWTVLKITLSVLGFWFAFSKIDFHLFRDALSNAQFSLLIVSLILYVLSQVVSSYRLQVVLDCVPHKIPFLWNLRLYFQGMAYNLFLPGGIGGDAYKTIAYAKKSNDKYKPKKYVIPLLGDRLIGLVGIVVLLTISSAFLTKISNYGFVRTLLFILTPAGLIVGYWLLKKFYKQYVTVYFLTIGLSIIIQLLQLLAVFFIAMSIGLNSVEVMPILATVFLVSTIATAIPVFLGGLGAREIVFASMFPIFGFDSEIGVLISILFSLIVVVSSVPGLGLGLVRD